MLKKLNFNGIKEAATRYILGFLELQFVITLMSLPLLIAWGIPISIMSPVSNFIFTPLLILFLWAACLSTICLLLHIPITFFDKLLEHITATWMYILSFGKPSWLIGFPCKMMGISIIICCIIFILYTYIKPATKHCVMILSSLWILIILMQPYFTCQQRLQRIGSLPLWLTRIGKTNYLIDCGALCTKKNLYTNLDFTVIPELIYRTGHPTVDGILFCKPSAKIDKVAKQCHSQLNCSQIFATKKQHCFEKLQQAFKDSDVQILPIEGNKKSYKSPKCNFFNQPL